MVTKSRDHQTYHPTGRVGFFLRCLLRFVQVLTALVVMGLYGRDLQRWNKANKKVDSLWVFAEVVAGLSFVTAIIYVIPFHKSSKIFPWDAILFILWTSLFGASGKRYIEKNCKGNNACQAMKAATWFDLIGMLLWFISAMVGAITFYRQEHSRSTYTSRSVVV